jgi:hypothetical protein
MLRGRLAVLGLCGVLLCAMVAGAVRIHTLEQRVASLEQQTRARVVTAQATPASAPLTLDWAPAGNDGRTLQPGPTLRFPDGARVPNGATPHEINGMTYYVMPLADKGGAASRR